MCYRNNGCNCNGRRQNGCAEFAGERDYNCGRDQQVIQHKHVIHHQHDIINEYEVVHEHDYNYYDVVRERDVVRHNDHTNYHPNYCGEGNADCGAGIGVRSESESGVMGAYGNGGGCRCSNRNGRRSSCR
ncbi:MAG: hypothetical protein FWH10_08770 [Oscillospiraceae bacterium]|nr:hypothetical protein [Oscillospiraceae bacterium]